MTCKIWECDEEEWQDGYCRLHYFQYCDEFAGFDPDIEDISDVTEDGE